ncbi:MAG: helix-turn-helix domain-containing protein [Bacteroidales bacterium]|nr:helix-turn-helix domain-containing protein [Bacteroidales bacterium]
MNKKKEKVYEQGAHIDFSEEDKGYCSKLLLALAMQMDKKSIQDIVKEKRAMVEKENTPESPERRLVIMNSAEVMDFLKICKRTLYNYRQKGILNGTKIGGKYLYRKEEVDRLIDGTE